MTNTQTVLELIHQVNAWSRFEGYTWLYTWLVIRFILP